METDMKLNPSSVRRLRESKNWSQDQLANASGLSLRTIQRVETEGAASRETRVCLAAALDVDVSAISEVRQEVAKEPTPNPWAPFAMAFTLVGVTMLLAALVSGAPIVLYYIAAVFLLFSMLSYAWKFWSPTGKA